MNVKMHTVFRKKEILHYIILLSGITCSVIQFAYNRSLWLDEAVLAINIMERNFWELTKPLDYVQVAPILFLQIVKLFATFFPDTEFGLRLFPLLGYWASLFFFYRLSKLILKSHTAIALALSLFICNYILIYYSSELKQYMTDVLVFLVLSYTTIKKNDSIGRDYMLLIVLGCICVFLSNVTPIILLTCGLYLVYHHVMLAYQEKSLKILSVIFSSWFISFLIYFILFVYNHPARNAMLDYWQHANAFLPANPISADFYGFLFIKVEMIFYTLLNFGKIGGICFIVLFVAGAVGLIYKKKIGIALFAFLPVMVHLVLSACKLYPFDLRLILYLTPMIILTIALGFDHMVALVLRYFDNYSIQILALLPALFFMVYFFYKSGFPIEKEEIKKAFRFIEENKRPEDRMYIYYCAIPAFKYYNAINYYRPVNPVIFGEIPNSDRSNILDQLTDIKGRVWLLFTHPLNNDDHFIVRKMDSLGYTQLHSLRVYGGSAFLYRVDHPTPSFNQ